LPLPLLVKTNATRLCLLASPFLLAGCMSTDPGPAFSDVQQTVGARTGQKIAWRQNSAEDRAADAAVAELLKRELTVNAAVQIALLNNPSLQATYEEIGISQADLVQAGLLKNPEFTNFTRFPDSGPSAADIELSVVQDFLDLFTLPLRKNVAETQLQQTKLQVGNDVLNLVADVKEAYYTMQAHQQLLHGLDLVLELNQTSADLAQQQSQAGTLNELDTEKQTVLYTQSRADVAQTQVDIDTDREKLNRLLGLSGSQIDWKIAGELPPVPARKFSVPQLETLALSQRLDVAAARTQVDKLKQSLGYTSATRFTPGGINVGGDTERNPDRTRVTGPTVDLQLPIFDQGQAQVAKAQDQFRQAHAQLNAAEVNARSEVREASHRLQAAQDLANLYNTTLLPQRRKILDLAQVQYNSMLKGAYDLLEAKEHEIDAERAAIEATRDYWVARAALERSVGGSLKPTSDRDTVAAEPITKPNQD
jgi:cobalt-zinc-cadmium efflux system outer membrane protein